jgi:small subunit ribosomal protein S1
MTRETNQDFETLLQESFGKKSVFEGSVVKGTVIDIQKDMAVVDIGLKSEGRIPLKEFGDVSLKVGDLVDVYIERYEDRLGDVQISHEKARQESIWQKLVEAFEEKRPVEGKIMSHVKGGLVVDLGGANAFLPGSQVDIRPIKDLGTLIGLTQTFLILKIDGLRSNIVISRRSVLEEARSTGRQGLLSTLAQGQKLEGIVKNITDYGAFVDLGGIDGLLHITDIAWKRVQHPSEVLSIGQTVSVVVTRFNKETQRISLGMKQLEKDPWLDIEKRCHVGDCVKGVITNVTDYGAFVELDEGIEGLIYVAEMSWSRKNITPSQIVSEGQTVMTKILDLDLEKRRISLGLKQCTENPFEAFERDHPVGSVVETLIKDVTEFGLILELPKGIDGTLHKSDLSWTESGEDLLAQYHTGDKLSVKVLNINVSKEIIGLGVKQLSQDSVDSEFSSLKKGETVECRVVQIHDNGLEVSIGNDLRSLIKRSDIAREAQEQDPKRFSIGDIVEAKVMSLNPSLRKVTLSMKAQEISDENEIMAEHSSQKENHSLGRILEDVLKKK